MKGIAFVLSGLCILFSTVNAVGNLQIIVENNIDDCEYRSQNGDLLYTYYTVRILCVKFVKCKPQIK